MVKLTHQVEHYKQTPVPVELEAKVVFGQVLQQSEE